MSDHETLESILNGTWSHRQAWRERKQEIFSQEAINEMIHWSTKRSMDQAAAEQAYRSLYSEQQQRSDQLRSEMDWQGRMDDPITVRLMADRARWEMRQEAEQRAPKSTPAPPIDLSRLHHHDLPQGGRQQHQGLVER